MNRARRNWFVSLLSVGLLVTVAAAAELEEQTRRAFDAYAAEATRVFVERARAGRGTTDAAAGRVLRDGEVGADRRG